MATGNVSVTSALHPRGCARVSDKMSSPIVTRKLDNIHTNCECSSTDVNTYNVNIILYIYTTNYIIY